uniref:Uncharacterized protein n=1 Tax=Arundo donax TaxID=35708 RepID=A0A0A9A828_ARUDO
MAIFRQILLQDTFNVWFFL